MSPVPVPPCVPCVPWRFSDSFPVLCFSVVDSLDSPLLFFRYLLLDFCVLNLQIRPLCDWTLFFFFFLFAFRLLPKNLQTNKTRWPINKLGPGLTGEEEKPLPTEMQSVLDKDEEHVYQWVFSWPQSPHSLYRFYWWRINDDKKFLFFKLWKKKKKELKEQIIFEKQQLVFPIIPHRVTKTPAEFFLSEF